jgi:hypothetical protein
VIGGLISIGEGLKTTNRNSFLTSKAAIVRSFRLLSMCEKTFILDKSARISGASTRTWIAALTARRGRRGGASPAPTTASGELLALRGTLRDCFCPLWLCRCRSMPAMELRGRCASL